VASEPEDRAKDKAAEVAEAGRRAGPFLTRYLARGSAAEVAWVAVCAA